MVCLGRWISGAMAQSGVALGCYGLGIWAYLTYKSLQDGISILVYHRVSGMYDG